MDRKSYQLMATREGRWWIVDVPEIGYRTQARTLAEVEDMGRDLIAGALDVDQGSFDLTVQVEPPADVNAILLAASAAEAAARLEAARAARDRRAAVARLHDDYGLSAIDTARVLGVSRGRVYQLLDEVPEEETALAA